MKGVMGEVRNVKTLNVLDVSNSFTINTLTKSFVLPA
jgi:hypothetical protein